jgi:hypothetical protein
LTKQIARASPSCKFLLCMSRSHRSRHGPIHAVLSAPDRASRRLGLGVGSSRGLLYLTFASWAGAFRVVRVCATGRSSHTVRPDLWCWCCRDQRRNAVLLLASRARLKAKRHGSTTETRYCPAVAPTLGNTVNNGPPGLTESLVGFTSPHPPPFLVWQKSESRRVWELTRV